MSIVLQGSLYLNVSLLYDTQCVTMVCMVCYHAAICPQCTGTTRLDAAHMVTHMVTHMVLTVACEMLVLSASFALDGMFCCISHKVTPLKHSTGMEMCVGRHSMTAYP